MRFKKGVAVGSAFYLLIANVIAGDAELVDRARTVVIEYVGMRHAELKESLYQREFSLKQAMKAFAQLEIDLAASEVRTSPAQVSLDTKHLRQILETLEDELLQEESLVMKPPRIFKVPKPGSNRFNVNGDYMKTLERCNVYDEVTILGGLYIYGVQIMECLMTYALVKDHFEHNQALVVSLNKRFQLIERHNTRFKMH